MAGKKAKSSRRKKQKKERGRKTNGKKVKIFLSHRSEDSAAVLKLKSRLEELSAGQLECFQSSAPGQIQAGDDWRKKIRNELSKSDALFLLFTDPSQTWDWCLYEVGLFDDLAKGEEQSMIICLCSYREEPPPSPLTSRQFVRATKPDLKQFLKELFTKPGFFPNRPAVNLRLKEETLELLATQLSNVLSQRPNRREYFTNWMELHITEPQNLRIDSIPGNAPLKPYKDCLRLFGMVQTPPDRVFWIWDDLIDSGTARGCFSNTDAQAWAKSIAEMLYAAKQGQTFEQKAALFKPTDREGLLRPILTRFEVESGGSMVFHLIFVTSEGQ